ncbi:MAG TPA: DNA-3-methyladenine glycosylase 2 family protein [Bryobacteraceae bacterium]|nr:DNA-3-methyladenine glycosylase 2 family protein [Bryobacteraceae bacterium]
MRHAVVHLKKSDPVLAGIIERVGPYRIQYLEPAFATLVRSIVFQQLSGRVARVIFDRLLNLLPERQLTPAAILALTVEQMRAAGLSNQKTKYIRDLAERTFAGEVDFTLLPGMSDDDVIAMLTQVKGVGVWTAHMFLIFALQRHDVLPVGDLGIRTAMRKAYRMRALPKPARMEKIARAWRPWCSVASWYLWRSLDGEAEL